MALAVEFFHRINSLYTVFFNHFLRAESIVSVDVHANALGDAGYIAADIAVSVDTEALALQFSTRTGVEQVTEHVNHQTGSQFSHSVRVLSRGIHGHDFVFGASRQVEIVVTGAGANHDLQVLGVFNDFLGHFVRTNNQSVGISHGFVQIVHIRVLFQQSQFEAGFFHNLTDSVHGSLGKRLFGSN